MELRLANSSTVLEVPDSVFGRPFNESLVHQAVVAFLAGARAGTRAQKNRSDVRGGGVKPWKQKGTGRARAGSSRSPLWRHGGVTFAARPQDHSQKLNRKMYRGAISSILSELVRLDRLSVVDRVDLAAPKTKEMVKWLAPFGQGQILLVCDEPEINMVLAGRNLSNLAITDVEGLNPVVLVHFDRVILTSGAVAKIGEWLA